MMRDFYICTGDNSQKLCDNLNLRIEVYKKEIKELENQIHHLSRILEAIEKSYKF